MASIVLSAAGMALGSAVGGGALGLSFAVVGRAAGAALGRALDERLLGAGSAPVETGRIDRFRLTGASEGSPVARVHGAVRLAGQVIWAGPFQETSTTTGGGKGAPAPGTTAYGYVVSLAIALCEGEVTGLGRVWADGVEVARDDLNLRIYAGAEDQQPDPLMEAIEGAGRVPAYRGIAYVLIEDLDLSRFGNRVPQLSFEVVRTAPQRPDDEAEDLGRLVRAVALIPGSGEYSLAASPVYVSAGFGETRPANVNTPQGKADLLVSLDALAAELPRATSVSLVVSWFGSDLRLDRCAVRPKVERQDADGEGMPWSVSGLARAQAEVVATEGGRPIYGGTPADAAVVEAVQALRARGKAAMFYPFILMDQGAGNALPDPYTGEAGQPALPWRGRITLPVAPGRPGSPDGTVAAAAAVAAFFGQAQASDFARSGTEVAYRGPSEWSFRRMILHYAHLCAAAGGVDAFCIGSEMRGVTTIRGPDGSFPAVAALRTLAADVKAVLPAARITYAADWTEYAGYQPEGEGATKLFHLDALWADPAIDAVGIDNYMPLSDWREGVHLDAHHGAVTDLDYLTGNVAGGELFDWFYTSESDREAQARTPITDGQGEPWVWRLKDVKGWWENAHRDRVNGVRSATPTSWVPCSKPVWFTELGCAAIDKGTNEPNKFLDPKSSESALPRYSNGSRDDFVQMQYLRAHYRHWADPVANPVSPLYGARMVDMDRAHVWAWDARPYPFFPANAALWSDGPNHDRGHWLNGRATARTLAGVVAEVCRAAGLAEIDTARLRGTLRGMLLNDAGTAREALQSLMLAYGFDAADRDGRLVFATRDGVAGAVLEEEALVIVEGAEAVLTRGRAPEAERAGRVQVGFLEAGDDYASVAADACLPDDPLPALSRSELPLVLSRAEGRRIAARWLAEARVGQDGARFALPPSTSRLGAGDVVRLGGASWRIDRVEDAGARIVDAVRVEPETYRPSGEEGTPPRLRAFVPPVPVEAVFLDLPLLKGDERPHAPHVAMTAAPWPGPVALMASDADAGYGPVLSVPVAATVGTTLMAMAWAPSGLWDRGPALRVRLVRGALSSLGEAQVLAGAGTAAIGREGEAWEVFQFAEATLVAPGTYDIRLRLRGQAGTDGVMPALWPAGSRFVLLDGVPAQWDMAGAHREVLRHYRWGPAAKPLSDPSWRHRAAAFGGVGFRPYSVCHLSARTTAEGTRIGWVRRTRIDGDSWTAPDVPLGEEREAYLVRVVRGGAVLREANVSGPAWTYAATMRTADGPGSITVQVAQVSDRYGPGPFAGIDLP